MVCLAALILAHALLTLRDQPSTAQWSVVVLVTALGMWTVPVMLFPAGGLALWFVLSALRGDTSQPRGDLARFALAAVATAILTVLLYSPIIGNNGLATLTDNSFVRASAWRVFFRQFSSSIEPTLAASTLGSPVIISAVIAALAVVGLVQERKTNGLRVSMAGSMYVWCAVVLLATHRAPYFRVWLFLVAPVALLAGHGLMRVVSVLSPAPERIARSIGALGIGVGVALATVMLVIRDVETSLDTGTLRDAERIASGFSKTLRPGDRVFAPIPSNAPLSFYFVRAGLDTTYLSSLPKDSSRVYLIVNTAEGYGINSGLRDPLLQKYHQAQLLARYASAEVYRLF